MPTLISLHNTFEDQHFKQYVTDRLVKTAHGTFYRDAAYPFAARIFELDKADRVQRASCQRLIFNKVWQPCNITKYKGLPPAEQSTR